MTPKLNLDELLDKVSKEHGDLLKRLDDKPKSEFQRDLEGLARTTRNKKKHLVAVHALQLLRTQGPDAARTYLAQKKVVLKAGD